MPDTQEQKQKQKYKYDDTGSDDQILQALMAAVPGLGQYAGMPSAGEDSLSPLGMVPPLDPQVQKMETPLGPMRPEEINEAAPAIGAQQLENQQKETDNMPFGKAVTDTLGERALKEFSAWKQNREDNFLEDNWGKLLTILAGTALQMVGAHNKNPSVFIGGSALSQLGGVQLGDYFRSGQQELAAIGQKFSQEAAGGRDVQAVLEMARDKVNELGRPLNEAEKSQIVGLFSLNEDQRKYVLSEMGSIAPGSAARALMDSMKLRLERLGREYINKPEYEGLPDDRKATLLETYLRDQVILGQEGDLDPETRANMRADEILGSLSDIARATIAGGQHSKFWGQEFGIGPATASVRGGKIQVKPDEVVKSPILKGLGSEDITGKKVVDIVHDNLMEIVDRAMYDEEGYLYIEVPSSTPATPADIRAGEGVMGGRVRERPQGPPRTIKIRVLADPIPSGVDRKTIAKQRIESAESGSKSLLHQDFIRYYRKVAQEAFIR